MQLCYIDFLSSFFFSLFPSLSPSLSSSLPPSLSSSLPPSLSPSLPPSLSLPLSLSRLWEDGWKERYYQSKFCVSCDDIDFVRRVVESYTEGLCWVMSYYYQVMREGIEGGREGREGRKGGKGGRVNWCVCQISK